MPLREQMMTKIYDANMSSLGHNEQPGLSTNMAYIFSLNCSTDTKATPLHGLGVAWSEKRTIYYQRPIY